MITNGGSVKVSCNVKICIEKLQPTSLHKTTMQNTTDHQNLQIPKIQEAPTRTPRNRLVQVSDYSKRCQLQKCFAYGHMILSLFVLPVYNLRPLPMLTASARCWTGSAWGLETHHTRCASRRDGALREYREGQHEPSQARGSWHLVLSTTRTAEGVCAKENASTALQVAARALYAHICAPPR